MTLEELRDGVRAVEEPGDWPSVSAIARWLTDIPRDVPGPGLASPVPAAVAPPTPSPAAPATIEDQHAPAEVEPPSLREWLDQGRALGRSAATRWLDKVRALVRRDED